jgi:ATP-dependent DNA helicase 2 subunit 2
LPFPPNPVPPRTKGRKRHRETDKPLSGLDIDALFHSDQAGPKRAKISPENAIPEFKQRLARAEALDDIQTAVSQMAAIVEARIRDSFGDANYARVVEELGVMRAELLELEEPRLYNEVLRGLKGRLLAGELGGERRELWWWVRRGGLGLLDKTTSADSDLSVEEAREFMKVN